MRGLFALALVGLLAGCLDEEAGPQRSTDDAVGDQPSAMVSCEPADKSNRGTSLNGEYYQDGTELWEETNGVTNLQRAATCEGPADTRIA